MFKYLFKILPVIFLVFLNNLIFCQELSYQNDSMFIEKFYVNELTTKATFDSLFQSTGKIKKRKSKFRIDNITNKKAKEVTWYYSDLGISIKKYSDRLDQISFGIKLGKDSKRREDDLKKLKRNFSGKLYIGDDLLNDKRNFSDLETLKSSIFSISKLTFGSYESILGGDLFYKQNTIRLSFDSQKNKLKSIFIHHNFKER